MKWMPIFYGIGIGALISVVVGTIVGLLGVPGNLAMTIIMFLLAYVPAGYFSANFNRSHPYASSALTGGMLAVMNQLVTMLFLTSGVLADPVLLSLGILFGTLSSIIGGLLADKLKRRQFD